jgi:hypothetical protein
MKYDLRKTTTMMFKMLSIERWWSLSQGALEKPRQMFLTQSPILASQVERYFWKLASSMENAPLSPVELRGLGDTVKENGPRAALHARDMINVRNDLPRNFNALEARHFPLFLTFDKVSSSSWSRHRGDIDIMLAHATPGS